MKTISRILAAVCLVAMASALVGADGPTKPGDNKVPAKAAPGKCRCAAKAKQTEKKAVMLTGSHIPQRVTQVGQITNGADPVMVITHDDLSRTGATNLAAALRKSVPSLH